ncbi:Dynein light chain Tctex-type 3 [Nibea albiflora]|uniref:Dynein light chain Tctex-type 3 n=1 Tax=Nibea albiflora TaxID=240163 RepID=A0ACB7ESA1_NIBAL|nr:Dynein light chain Tctex-type 3 [Nibea albiflora]
MTRRGHPEQRDRDEFISAQSVSKLVIKGEEEEEEDDKGEKEEENVDEEEVGEEEEDEEEEDNDTSAETEGPSSSFDDSTEKPTEETQSPAKPEELKEESIPDGELKAAEIMERPDTTDQEKKDDGTKPANGTTESNSKSQSGSTKKTGSGSVSSPSSLPSPFSSLSSDGCPSLGRSRPTGTKPQRTMPSAGMQPSRERLPLLLLLLGAATQRQTEVEHSKDLCRLEPGGLALVLAQYCDSRNRTLRWPQRVKSQTKGSLGCIESVVAGDDYSQSQVNKWTASIVERCLTQLVKQGKPYKYIAELLPSSPGQLLKPHRLKATERCWKMENISRKLTLRRSR